MTLPLCAQRPQIRFNTFSIENGLSDNTVNSIFQDSEDFLWFGTQNGLNKFDGYEYQHFYHDIKDSNSISGNTIDCMLEDKEGHLWIGTFEGLNLYDKKVKTFSNANNTPSFNAPIFKGPIFDIDIDTHQTVWVASGWMGIGAILKGGTSQIYNTENGLPSNNTTSIVVDNDGVWIGTTEGLSFINSTTKKITNYLSELPNDSRSVNDILKIGTTLWIGTKTCLLSFDTQTKKYNYYIHNPQNQYEFFSKRNVLKIVQGEEGKLCLGTNSNGFISFDITTKSYYEYGVGGASQLVSSQVRTILIDHANTLWIGGNNGVSYSNIKTNLFSNFLNTGEYNTGLSQGIITTIYKNKEHEIWIGTDKNGVNVINPITNEVNKLFYTGQKEDLNNNHITSVVEYNDLMYIATFGGGINIYDPKYKTFEFITEENGLLSNEISSLTLDDKNQLWISTSTKGISVWNIENHTFQHFQNNPQDAKSLSDDMINFIFVDSKKQTWVGTYKGLNLYNPISGEFTKYVHSDTDSNTLSNDFVTCMYEDHEHNYWVGTGDGLNLFNSEMQFIKTISEKDGLPSNVVYSIVEDVKNDIWLSTDNGLCAINKNNNHIIPFDVKDGIQGKRFSKGSVFKDENEHLYFGGENGFTLVLPENFTENKYIPKVHITDFQLFYENVIPSPTSKILKKDISNVETLTLNYNQNHLTFKFVALNYIVPENNEYKYKLIGFDNKWIHTKDYRSATYTNLAPGEYTFQVIASNNDGLWNKEGQRIEIIINPPFWHTWWFRIIASIFIIGLLILFFRFRVRNIQKRNRILEHKVLERTKRIMVQKEEIELQKEEIISQRDLILQHKEQMEDSIEVGKMIQMSVLPPQSQINKIFKESFVYYSPKDIVSGDFYWFYKRENRVYIAAADCTGHGVAGAFLTILGHNHLHEIVEQDNTLTAAEILDQLNLRMISTLRQRADESVSRDGMDITLCVFENEQEEFQLAGAMNSLYIIRKGSTEIEQHKVNTFSIGIPMRGDVKPFKNFTIPINKGDNLYLFSDGYADQFGGPNGDEKYKYYRFRNLIVDIKDLPYNKQGQIIKETITNWKGDGEQTDDILVMGLKW